MKASTCSSVIENVPLDEDITLDVDKDIFNFPDFVAALVSADLPSGSVTNKDKNKEVLDHNQQKKKIR